MTIKNKIASLLPIVAVGLLLGGNACADGTATELPQAQTAAAQIEQIEQKIAELTAQIETQQAPAPVMGFIFYDLTQADLDRVGTEVSRIAGEVARVKIEVEIFAVLREIKVKTAAIAAQIPSGAKISTPSVFEPVQTPAKPLAADSANQEIENKIAVIKQQIDELTQELKIQKIIEQGQPEAQAEEGGNLIIEEVQDLEQETQTPIVIESAPKTEKTTPSGEGGFWQSVGDFLKKIFTF